MFDQGNYLRLIWHDNGVNQVPGVIIVMRIFVGISPPDEICESLAGLSTGLPQARWVDPTNMHITLSFIGEADDVLVQDIDNALSDIRFSEFELTLTNPGCFESRHMARTLWVGVVGSEPLGRLKSKVDIALARTGVDLERHRFKPHVTIARLKKTPARTIIPYMETHGEFAKGPFTVDHFTLFRSHLGKTGANYEPLAKYHPDHYAMTEQIQGN